MLALSLWNPFPTAAFDLYLLCQSKKDADSMQNIRQNNLQAYAFLYRRF